MSIPSSRRATDDIDILVGKRITEMRVLAGITRNELAEKVGVTHQQLHKYEKALNRISISRLVDIADALGVGLDMVVPQNNRQSDNRTVERQRLSLEMMRDFQKIDNDGFKNAVRELIRELAQS